MMLFTSSGVGLGWDFMVDHDDLFDEEEDGSDDDAF